MVYHLSLCFVLKHDKLSFRFKKARVNEAPEDEEEDEDEETVKAKKLVVSPITLWIGVFLESTSATAAHDTAQDVLALSQGLPDY